MTIEEILLAKQETEKRIVQELQALSRATGTHVSGVQIMFLDVQNLGSRHGHDRLVSEVRIDLRVP